jgi:hypothetical protein
MFIKIIVNTYLFVVRHESIQTRVLYILGINVSHTCTWEDIYGIKGYLLFIKASEVMNNENNFWTRYFEMI